MALGFSRIRSLWHRGGDAGHKGYQRQHKRTSLQRKMNHSFLRIREINQEDENYVRTLLFDHFRQLTFPAIIYWVVQHAYDLLAIIVILSFMLPMKDLLYFVVAFVVYLYVRARWEMEKHIRYSCPDLDEIHDTYRTAKGANFWVGYFSKEDDALTITEANVETLQKHKTAVGGGDDRHGKGVAGAKDEELSDKRDDNADGQLTPVNETDTASRGGDSGRQGLSSNRGVSDDRPMSLKDLLNKTNCKENEILGCIGIAPYRNKSTIAQMVRLVVSKKCRGMKVGSRLLNHLEKYAINFGYTEIRVYTNNLNTEYLQFLKQNGFLIQQLVRRGLMRGDLIIWNKTLSQPNDLLVPETQPITSMGTTLILE